MKSIAIGIKADIDGEASITESDVNDPERTFVAFVISKTALHKPI